MFSNSEPDEMKLILIRHAKAKRVPNPDPLRPSIDEGLTPAGIDQVRAMAERFVGSRELAGCDVFFCSPLQRAVETARLLGRFLGFPACVIEANLSEIGEMPGREAETLEEAFSRVRYVMNDLAERYRGKRVVAVSHAAFIMATIRVLFDIPTPGSGARLDPNYASCTEWSFDQDVWRLERYNV